MRYLPLFLVITLSSFAQHQEAVDFLRARMHIVPVPEETRINGTVTYEFKVLQSVDSIFLDAKNMDFSSVLLNGKKIKFLNDRKVLTIINNFNEGKEYQLNLVYSCRPMQTVYFLGWDDGISGNEQIWTQGQGKYTSHWLPSFDDMNEKVEFDLKITAPADYRVVANGKYVKGGLNVSNRKQKDWVFDMQKPMSSYLLAFAIGNYNKQELKSSSGVPIENYYYPKDSLRVEPTFRYTKEIFDFLEEEIGVPYPWQNYKQIPVQDFLYAGMENTGTTIFSDGYFIDSLAFVDKNYVNVNAHELAHQWFGNLVTEKDGQHHWLHEGFATYYAYLAEKEVFGDDHFYWKLQNSLDQLKNTADNGGGQSLLDPKANSLTFYEKGAWALFMLREKIGDASFKEGIKNYLNTYQYKNVTVDDFLREMEKASGKELNHFRIEWLESTSLPFDKGKSVLSQKCTSIKQLHSLENEIKTGMKDTIGYLDYWEKSNSENFRQYLLETYFNQLPHQLIEKAFASGSLLLRQSLATNFDSIPLPLKPKYESLLNDKSYITLEQALLKLWVSFPKERKEYLEKTKGIIGLPNKNIRLLWLTLTVLTQDYEAGSTQHYFTELSNYTSPKYGWEVRLNAFQYLREIGFNDTSLINLINASVHHSWQFKKFARELLDELLKDPDYKMRIEKLSNGLNEEELRYINTKISKK